MTGRFGPFYAIEIDGEVFVVEDTLEWAKQFEETSHTRRVALTLVGSTRISTVFLGLNHNHQPGGDPLWYETMVFDQGHGGDVRGRYATRAEASEGHQHAVSELEQISGEVGLHINHYEV